ncbi:hypothetical protein OG389_05575 [Streptomyces sp. NBC_00435]|uniref:hypothetical protein n=1 Tax=Streptomyces sp. NBC_00435 TaxID=2903649 RepID=UPI002E206838
MDSLTTWLDREPRDEEDIEAGRDEERERYDRARNFRSDATRIGADCTPTWHGATTH